MSTNKDKEKETAKKWDISAITRDAVVGTAERARILQDKTAEELKKATERVVGFGKEAHRGFKEGVAEVKKRNNERFS